MAIDKLGTKFTTGAWLPNVKTFYKKINEIIDYLNGTGSTGSGSYKKYVATLLQAGAGVPAATIMENTTGGTITWTRLGPGEYQGTTSGFTLTDGKTLVFMSPNANASITPSSVYWQRTGDTTIYILTMEEGSDNNSDNILKNTSFELRVYN